MTKQMMIYESATPVTAQRHRDWSVKAGTRYGFARELTAVPLMTTEFAAMAQELPIVFAGDEKLMPAAITGLRRGENLMVGPDEAWRGRYAPAFLRQYPFVLAGKEDETLTLCIDEAFEGANTEGRGERLFDAEGERTAYLTRVLDFATLYQRDHRASGVFCEKLRALDLLETMNARITAPAGPMTVQGFQAVSRERLRALPPETLADLMRTGALELIYAHLLSLKAFDRLAEQVPAAAPATAEPADA